MKLMVPFFQFQTIRYVGLDIVPNLIHQFNSIAREQLLTTIVVSDELHAKWLNTLSFLENCGARKIAACEHPTLVKEEMLKHAAEEFRHAHHLKRQIKKVSSYRMETYSLSSLLFSVIYSPLIEAL